jgi:hypothetical protein
MRLFSLYREAYSSKPTAWLAGESDGVRSESTSLRKAGARRCEAWSENFSTEKYL